MAPRMRASFALVAAVTLFAVLCAASPAAAAVKTLTTSDFEKELEATDVAFVKFYAPWCGHCKALAPIFVEASDKLKDEALLAEVDCTVEKALAQRFGIKGFPTLILFKKGKEAGRYEGPRELNDLVQYVRSQLGDAMRLVNTTDELLALKESAAGTPLCVIKTAAADSALALHLTLLAETLRSVMVFAIVTDLAVLPNIAMETVTVMRAHDEVETFSGDVTDEAAVRDFLKTATTPYFGEINAQTYRAYVTIERPMGWVYLSQNSSEDLKTLLTSVAQKHREKVVMCWLNADLYGAVGKQMALPDNVTYPAFVIEHNKQHHVHPLNETIDETTIDSFIERFIRGEVTPTLRSQPVPEQETTDGLTVFVGSTLPLYMQSNKDILVFFYAPWCQHCKNLHPTYNAVAKRFEGSEHLLIGKFDVTENDVDSKHFTVEGFPTLYFVPANQSPIVYSGDRSEQSLVDFVRTHATHATRLTSDAADTADKAADKASNATQASSDSAEAEAKDDL